MEHLPCMCEVQDPAQALGVAETEGTTDKLGGDLLYVYMHMNRLNPYVITE